MLLLMERFLPFHHDRLSSKWIQVGEEVSKHFQDESSDEEDDDYH